MKQRGSFIPLLFLAVLISGCMECPPDTLLGKTGLSAPTHAFFAFENEPQLVFHTPHGNRFILNKIEEESISYDSMHIVIATTCQTSIYDRSDIILFTEQKKLSYQSENDISFDIIAEINQMDHDRRDSLLYDRVDVELGDWQNRVCFTHAIARGSLVLPDSLPPSDRCYEGYQQIIIDTVLLDRQLEAVFYHRYYGTEIYFKPPEGLLAFKLRDTLWVRE